MQNLTTKDDQLQGNQHQEAQTAFMASHGRENGPSEHRVAKVTGSCGNSGRCRIYALAEEPSIQFRESKTPGHKIKR